MLKLDYWPERLLNELNQMNKLSMFKQDHCLRMLDGLLETQRRKDAPVPKLDHSLLDKLLN